MKQILIWGSALLILTSCKQAKKESESADPDSVRTEDTSVQSQEYEMTEVRSVDPEVIEFEKARTYAMEAQKTLGKTLKAKIAEAGPAAAIGFCNERALPITDSVARSYGVKIQRVTDRPRNPANRASEAEAGIMASWADSLLAGRVPGPLGIAEKKAAHYYFPIQTNALCMNCHGKPEKEITPEVLTLIRETYPQDEAMGYAPDQLRGMWKISFEREEQNPEP